MRVACQGSTVVVSYIGTLDTGRIFDETAAQGPLTFTIGAHEVFPALEQEVIGMQPGDVRNIVLTAAEGYGPRHPENILRLGSDASPAGKEITGGQKLSIVFKGGAARVMQVTAVSETVVTLDGNHPLAGQELTFGLKVERVE